MTAENTNGLKKYKRIPKHIGIIPDGNRRWALEHNLDKQDGYEHGVNPGNQLYELMLKYGIQEATFYGFTKDNTTRPKVQTDAYTKACIDAVEIIANRDANILVIGNTESKVFPDELRKYANKRVQYGKGLMNINYLVNYDWNWDLNCGLKADIADKKSVNMLHYIASSEISRMDLIIRWGGRRRLSGFLPVQSVYSDFYIIDEYWPAFKEEHFFEAMDWYQDCDVTLGG